MAQDRSLFDISGKIALVTGGSSGIGAMIVEGLVRAGVRVFVCARKPEKLDQIVTAMSVLGQCTGIRADIANDEGIQSVVDALAPLGRLDILVNNAGKSNSYPLGSFSRAAFESALNINLTAPFLVAQALLPLLRKAASREDPARVINIASLAGMRATGLEHFSYCASKAGVIMLTEHLARHLAPDDITVNAISPGFFPSRMTGATFTDPERVAQVASPLANRTGMSDDIVGLVTFLCSRAGAWHTGINIPLSGGRKIIDA
jgi:NAD(P)-dependent dehydrogenase (short-subunit alcohol dehydrogenase family)